jgi:hypothetical protein
LWREFASHVCGGIYGQAWLLATLSFLRSLGNGGVKPMSLSFLISKYCLRGSHTIPFPQLRFFGLFRRNCSGDGSAISLECFAMNSGGSRRYTFEVKNNKKLRNRILVNKIHIK